MAILDNSSPDIPVINLQALTSGGAVDAAARADLAKELRRKITPNGFVAFEGHGIPEEHLEKALELSRAFFKRSLAQKEKAIRPLEYGPIRRGYSTIGRENAAIKHANAETDPVKKEELFRMMDYKETYEIGSNSNPGRLNIWMPDDDFPGFRQFHEDFYWEIQHLSWIVLELLIQSLGLTAAEADQIRALNTGQHDLMRHTHYPPKPASAKEDKRDLFSRIGPHTDYCMFTLLFQDYAGGLEFQDMATSGKDMATGRYISATPVKGRVYMNIGDLFELLSNGVYKAAPHRVVGQSDKPGNHANRSGASASDDRYSLVYFATTDLDRIVEPMPSLITPERKAMCKPMTWGEYSLPLTKQTLMDYKG